jgi:hypothetical protein
LRLLAVVVLMATVLAAALSVSGAVALTRSTDHLRSGSGPALVATQEVFSSLAEADAAATAAFLSGRNEDREQRRLYEDALGRSAEQLTEVAHLVGGSGTASEAVRDLASRLTTYAGLVETARAYQRNGIAGGDAVLTQAINVARNGIGADIDALNTQTQRRFDGDEGAGRAWLLGGIGLTALAVVALVATQVYVARTTRRIFNLPLVAASLLLVGAGTWLVLAVARQQSDLDAARTDGYASIALTSQIQTLAYRARADESLALVEPTQPPGAPAAAAGQPAPPAGSTEPPTAGAADGRAGGPADGSGTSATAGNGEAEVAKLAAAPVSPDLVVAARDGRLGREPAGLLLDLARAADGPREQAAAAEVLVRWARYADQRAMLQDAAAEAGGHDQAVALAVGPVSSTFYGFNVSVERVLADNQAQFDQGLSSARQRLRGLRVGTVAVPLLAALLALWGLKLRIDEYR